MRDAARGRRLSAGARPAPRAGWDRRRRAGGPVTVTTPAQSRSPGGTFRGHGLNERRPSAAAPHVHEQLAPCRRTSCADRLDRGSRGSRGALGCGPVAASAVLVTHGYRLDPGRGRLPIAPEHRPESSEPGRSCRELAACPWCARSAGDKRGTTGNHGEPRMAGHSHAGQQPRRSGRIHIRHLPNWVPLSGARSPNQGDDCCLDGFDVRITII